MIDNIRRVFLVDYENTSVRGLYGISCLGANCKVVVFCSSTVIQKAVEDVLKVYELRNVEISTFLLIKPGKNALDFMISTYLGYEVNQSIDKEIYIVSSDHGFESAMEMAKQLDSRMTISSHRNIFECLPAHMRQGRYDIEDGLLLENKSSQVLLLEDKLTEEPKVETVQEATAKTENEEAEKPAAAEKKEPVRKEKAMPEKHTAEKNAPKQPEASKESVVSSLLGVFRKKQKPEAKDAAKEAAKPAAVKEVKTQSVKEEKPTPKKETKPVEKKTEPNKEPLPKKAAEAAAPKKEEPKKKREKQPKQKVIVEVIEVEEDEVLTQPAVTTEEIPAQTSQKQEKKYPAISKAKKQVLRDKLMEYMKAETSIPEKFHQAAAAAMTNSQTFSECSEKLELVYGHKHTQYIGQSEQIFRKYR